MNKLAFIMSSILVLIGVILIAVGQLVEAVLPKIGHMAFLVAKSGSYSENDYALNLGVYY